MLLVVCGILLGPLDPAPVFVKAQEHCQVLDDVFSENGAGDARYACFDVSPYRFPCSHCFRSWTLFVCLRKVEAFLPTSCLFQTTNANTSCGIGRVARKYFNTRWSTKHVNIFPTRLVPTVHVRSIFQHVLCRRKRSTRNALDVRPQFSNTSCGLSQNQFNQHQLCPEYEQYYFPTPVLPVVKREQFPNTSCDLFFYIICFTLTHVAPILDLITPFSEFSKP